MKKLRILLALLLVLTLALTFSSCGSGGNDNDDEGTSTDQTQDVDDADDADDEDGEDEFGETDDESALAVARKLLTADMLDEKGRIIEKYKARIARRLFNYGYNTSLIYSSIDIAVSELKERMEE